MAEIKRNRIGKIYIIVPIYNCREFIEDAINSVLKQSYKNIEIVIIDDGSVDGSSEFCDNVSIKNNNIHVIHQMNSGVSMARNVGIDYVISCEQGYDNNNYIAFLDADDAWHPDFLSDHIYSLMECQYQLIGFQSVYCNVDLSRKTEPTELQEGVFHGGTSSIWLHGKQHFGAMLYKVSFLKEYNIRFQLIKYSEDKIFSMECMYLADEIYLENRLLYLYRQNRTSAMNTREYGIDYYIPIIDAYLEIDRRMIFWKNDRRGVLHEGTILARIYIMDMIDEHYQHFGSQHQINVLWKEKEKYKQILNTEIGEKQITERWISMYSHPFMYKSKMRIIGVILLLFQNFKKMRKLTG